MSPKRAAPKSTTQKQLDQLPLLKKPLEQIGKQIKIPGSFWEGTMTAEEKALEYFCTVRDFSAMHKFVGGDCSQAFQREAQEANDAAIAASLQAEA